MGWSEVDYGYIVTAFLVAYAIGLITTGRFPDKFGTRIRYIRAIPTKRSDVHFHQLLLFLLTEFWLFKTGPNLLLTTGAAR
jgi:MFS family permease